VEKLLSNRSVSALFIPSHTKKDPFRAEILAPLVLPILHALYHSRVKSTFARVPPTRSSTDLVFPFFPVPSEAHASSNSGLKKATEKAVNQSTSTCAPGKEEPDGAHRRGAGPSPRKGRLTTVSLKATKSKGIGGAKISFLFNFE
jgi:hypothetical protein